MRLFNRSSALAFDTRVVARNQSSRSFFVLCLLVLLPACADPVPQGVLPDLQLCTTYECAKKCDNAIPCPNGLRCDPADSKCYACVVGTDCRDGEVCDRGTHQCVPGCSIDKSCGDAGLCELDAGACFECLSDANCPVNKPRCDPSEHKCWECNPLNDNCPLDKYCAGDAKAGYACAEGCKTDKDCPAANGDGGEIDIDGGIPVGRCNPMDHRCVRCALDSDCPAGRVCDAKKQCVAGCTNDQPCPAGLSCCAKQCVDTKSDWQNCGGCGDAINKTNICEGGFNCCASKCSNPAIDNLNCGMCGNVCDIANGEPECVARTCGVLKCNDGFGDCNRDPRDGCEVNLKTSAIHCGACNSGCQIPRAQAKCVAGLCAVDACILPFADCNGDVNDGCELNVGAEDEANCGGCGVVCVAPNGVGACERGLCIVGACNAPFSDCDNDKKNGCEINVEIDVANCGACNSRCAPANATPACNGGRCEIGACDLDRDDCNLMAKDGCEVALMTDVLHCGKCGNACSNNNAAPSCNAGACKITCLPGFADCNNDVTDGCEINLNIDVTHCGKCASVCSGNGVPNPSCDMGVCNGACGMGRADCNGDKLADGCEIETPVDISHCGGCGNICSPNHVPMLSCGMGVCDGACEVGFDDCNANKLTDGCETDVVGDVANCGGCRIACSANHVARPACGGGVCNGACNVGFDDCNGNKLTDGCEIDIRVDQRNCGGCTNSCSGNNIANPSCAGGLCNGACDMGFADCNRNKLGDGCEIDTQGNPIHCGACGVSCSQNHIANPACAGGICNGACDAGFDDCNGNKLNDGCEINLLGDPANCGACNTGCSQNNIARACDAGACDPGQCNQGFADCNMDKRRDGCEINVAGDVANCGGCGTVCSTNHIARDCSGGSCSAGMCEVGYSDCNTDKQVDGCEINTAGDVDNCGGCKITCSGRNIARSCTGGLCDGACDAGFADCNNNRRMDGCEIDLNGDAVHCGGCGQACSANNIARACQGGACDAGQCNAGYTDCNNNKRTDGCEINSAGDANNCGGCGTVCSTTNMASRTCMGGTCNGACNAGFGDCNANKQSDGCETNTDITLAHCGACGNACPNVANGQRTCGQGVCGGTCSANFGDCDNSLVNGCEANFLTNASHCGGCGNVCAVPNGTPGCGGGGCQVASCNPGFHNVDGNVANGCECANDASGSSCANATVLGALALGQSAEGPIGKLPIFGMEDWYVFDAPFNPTAALRDSSIVDVQFITNDANAFRFEVTRSCNGGPLCNMPATHFQFTDNASIAGPNAYTTRDVQWPDKVFVRVTRVTPGDSCLNYKLRISR